MTASGKGRKWALIVLVVVIILFIGGIVSTRVAVEILKDKVVQTLGPNSEVKDIRVSWSCVDVVGLRIKGDSGWPSEDTLRADRVTLVPSMRSFLSGKYRIHSITVINPYLSIFRNKAGKVMVVPSLTSGKMKTETSSEQAASTTLAIEQITLKDGVVELFDATVARPHLKIRMEQIQANIQDLAIPSLNDNNRFGLTGVLKGIRQDGRVDVAGWANLATKDSSVKLQLRSVDLVALHPYLTTASDTGVQKGTLDLDLQSDVRSKKLKAPGKVTISDLKLAPAKGMFGSFMGVPRNGVLGFLKDNKNKITLNFTLEGHIDNPKFTLREALAQRLAVSMADSLKVSIGGVVKGAGSLGEKGVETATGVVKGVGGAVQNLFGSKK
jgi:hypothetical protein